MISVLLPSRGRLEALLGSVNSLLLLADNPDEIEVLVAGDPDDRDSIPAGWLRRPFSSNTRAWIAPQRYGYTGLHRYVNFLAKQASGDWLMLWNDDARMITDKWDSIVTSSFPSADRVLWPVANHDEGGNLFPLWPRAWTALLGYVSLSPNIDVWISELGRRLHREQQVGILVKHDRADITGGHDDETYAEGRAQMGRGNDQGYDSQENRAARAHAVKTLREYLAVVRE